MRLYSWTLVGLLIVLLAGAIPVRAADNGVVTIDIEKATPEPLLAPEEVEQIAQLQTSLASAVIVSPISPDDSVALAIIGQSIGFLNIQDGTYAPFNPEETFANVFPLALFGLGEFVWTDANTLVSVGVGAPAEEGGNPQSVLVVIDRTTGQAGGIPLNLSPNVLPVSLSPDASKVLLLINESSEQTPPAAAEFPITYPTGGLPEPKLPRYLQRRADALIRQIPALGAPPVLGNGDYHALQLSQEPIRLAVYDVNSGEATELLTVPFGTAVAGLAWKPDSTTLALSLISLFPADQELRSNFDGALISEQIYRDVTGSLPPGENPFLQNNTIELFDMLGGEHQTIRAADGNGDLLIAKAWSPDSQTLLVQAISPGNLRGREYPIYTIQFADAVSYRFYNNALEETGRIEAPELSAPTPVFGSIKSELFVGNDEVIISGLVGSDVHPFYYNRATGEFRNIADRAGSYVRIFATRASRQIVFLYTSYTSPPDLYRVNWDGSALARLSWVNYELEQFSQTRQDPVSFRLADGTTRVGTLIQPADAAFPPRDVPLVVWQEGGPGVPIINVWQTNVENPYGLIPNLGMALLVVPLAGRHGYGPAAYDQLADNNNFGQRDIDEMAEVVRQMIRRGYTSQGKIGITGCSYGGYFSWQSIIRHPDLYAAANPQCALVDAVTEWSRGFPTLMPYLQEEPPFADPEEYQQDSPFYNASRVKAAVLSFHGTNDFLPITQNENVHLQLVQRGVPARMLRFAGAGHGLALPDWQLIAAQEQIQWFRTYLAN